MRRLALAAIVLFAASTLLTAQSPAPQRFEVASVKLDPEQGRGTPPSTLDAISAMVPRVTGGGRFQSNGYPIRSLMMWAWELDAATEGIEGNRDFLDTELLIVAKAANPEVTIADVRPMIRTLLEERFTLRWRLQPREVDGYVLVPSRDDGRPGRAVRAFTGDCEARKQNEPVRAGSPDYQEKARCGWSEPVVHRQIAIGVSTAQIAATLERLMGSPVSERTGWSGLFSFEMMASTQNMPRNEQLLARSGRKPPEPKPNDPPQLLDVMRSELGLRLMRGRATVSDLIIESFGPLIED